MQRHGARPTRGLLLKHVHDLWHDGETFMPTVALVAALVNHHPEEWGMRSPFGKALTAQRFGRMLASSHGTNSTRLDRTGPRGHAYAGRLPVWHRMGVVQGSRRSAPVPETLSEGTGASGAGGSAGAGCECSYRLAPGAHCSSCEVVLVRSA